MDAYRGRYSGDEVTLQTKLFSFSAGRSLITGFALARDSAFETPNLLLRRTIQSCREKPLQINRLSRPPLMPCQMAAVVSGQEKEEEFRRFKRQNYWPGIAAKRFGIGQSRINSHWWRFKRRQ